jgi:hypothetical protein
MSEMDAVSDSGMGIAFSFPLVDIMTGFVSRDLLRLLDAGLSTTSSTSRPDPGAARFAAKSIMLGTDEVGVGVARAILLVRWVLRWGRVGG